MDVGSGGDRREEPTAERARPWEMRSLRPARGPELSWKPRWQISLLAGIAGLMMANAAFPEWVYRYIGGIVWALFTELNVPPLIPQLTLVAIAWGVAHGTWALAYRRLNRPAGAELREG